MKKIFSKSLSVLLVAVLLFSATGSAFADDYAEEPRDYVQGDVIDTGSEDILLTTESEPTENDPVVVSADEAAPASAVQDEANEAPADETQKEDEANTTEEPSADEPGAPVEPEADEEGAPAEPETEEDAPAISAEAEIPPADSETSAGTEELPAAPAPENSVEPVVEEEEIPEPAEVKTMAINEPMPFSMMERDSGPEMTGPETTPEATPSGTPEATPSGAPEVKEVALKYLDVSGFKVTDQDRIFAGGELSKGEVDLQENGTLKALPDAPQQIAGWEFVGWYTKPVKYAFWGDTTTSDEDYETIPKDFEKDCDGNANDFKSKDPGIEWNSYWRWLSTLVENGEKVNLDTNLSGISAIYALYKPTVIEYSLYYNGWGGQSGVLKCSRQYGTPFGKPFDVVKAEANWPGFKFNGWYDQNGDQSMDFYSIPYDGACYFAHWQNTDASITQDNYQRVGYKPVTSIALNYSGKKNLHLDGSLNLTATVYPAKCGVTQLKWKSSNDNLVRLEGEGLTATVTALGKEGTVEITATSDNGLYAKLTLNVGHVWGTKTLTQYGNCSKPTKYLCTCSYCKKTQVVEEYAKHKTAILDVPATCTTKHFWVSYCKVCGETFVDQSTEKGPALGHTFETTEVSGCGGKTTTKTCTRCGFVEVTQSPEGAQHVWADVPTVDIHETCHTEGSQSIKCVLCGVTKPESSEVRYPDPSLHKWTTWSDPEPATSGQGEVQRLHCTNEGCTAQETRTAVTLDYYTSVSTPSVSVTTDVEQNKSIASSKEVVKQAVQKTVEKIVNDAKENKESALADDILYATSMDSEISTEILVTPSRLQSKEDKKIFGALALDEKTTRYIDIDILVKAGEKAIGRITETEEVMTFTADLPAGGRIVRVFRAHDNEAEGTSSVEEIPSFVKGNTVYFTTDKFSTFAVSVSNDIAHASVGSIGEQTYTGSEIRPKVEVTINGDEALTEGKDYTVTFRNNVEAGTATAVITGIGDFEGTTQEVTFQIAKAAAPEVQAPTGTPESSTGTQNNGSTDTQNNGSTDTQNNGSTGTQNNGSTDTQNNGGTGAQNNASTGTQNGGSTGTQSSASTGTQNSGNTGTQNSSTSTATATNTGTSPATGDEANAAMWSILAVFSIGCLAVLAGNRRRNYR